MNIRKRKMTKVEQIRFAAEMARGTPLQPGGMAEVRSKIAAHIRNKNAAKAHG